MGEVYLAEDTRLERKVALKFLPRHLSTDPKLLARFQREAKATAALNHANIITVYECGEHEDRAYIAMEYIDGHSLRQLVSRAEIPLHCILDIVSQICAGLSHAHQAGIVHRDLKPENIMLDADNKAKILDFGLAKLKGKTNLSFTKSALGTVSYMAPEQCEGLDVDHRADIWAVGVMLYEMVVGKLPFDGEHEAAIIYATVSEEPQPLARHKPGVSPNLQHIVDKALDKDHNARYQSINELLADLDHVRKNEAVSAKPMSRLRKRQIARSLLRFAALVAVIAMAVVAGVFVFEPQPTSNRLAVHKQVTFVGDATHPSISPDGKSLAYLAGKLGNKKVMIKNLADEHALEVAPQLKIYGGYYFGTIKWYPDGSRITLLGFSNLGAYSIYSVGRFGGNARIFSSAYNISWSPDGSHIAHADDTSKRFRITNAVTDQLTVAFSASGKFNSLRTFGWSPCSNRLSYLTKGDDHSTIWTIRIDGSEEHEVVQDNNPLISHVWSANGTAIYYLRTIGRTKQLLKVRISTKTGKAESRPEVLQSGILGDNYFSISHDNKRLFYTRELRFSNLWYLDLRNGNTVQSLRPRQLTTGTLANFAPSISPDGKMIAFSVAKGEYADIFSMPLAGGQMQQITYMNAYNANPAWSPDGREIAFVSWQEDSLKIWKVSVRGGEPQPFTQSQVSTSPYMTWFPGNKILYERRGERNFNMLDPINQEETTLLDTDLNSIMICCPRFSPDGKSVAAYWRSRFGSNGIWRIFLDDTKPRLLQAARFVSYPIAWTNEGKYLYAMSQEKQPFELLRIDTESGKTKTIYTLPFDEIDGISMTPDGKQLVFAGVEKSSDIWYLENFDPENELQEPFIAPRSPVYEQLAYLEKGRKLMREREYVTAANLYRKGLKLDPSNKAVLKELGRCLSEQKNHSEAEAVFRVGVARHPDDNDFQIGLSWSLFYQERYLEAEESFRAGLERFPQEPRFQVGLGWLLYSQAKYAETEKFLREHIARKPQDLAKLGWEISELQSYAEVEKVFRLGLALYPQEIDFLNGLGWSLNWQKRFSEAEEIFQQGLVLNPENLAILNGLHRVAVANKNYGAAKRYGEGYLTHAASPRFKAFMLSNLGTIGIVMKDYPYAEKHFRDALAIDSTNSDAYRGLGYLRAAQDLWSEAERYGGLALELDSSYANYNLAGWVLVGSEIDIDRGIAFAQKALASEPEDWRETVKSYPYQALPEYTLGLAYLKKNEYPKAVQYLEQAAALAPEKQVIRDDLQLARQKLQ